MVVVRVTTPLTSATGLPTFIPSTWNCTVPPEGVAVLGALAITFAMNVTFWPAAMGLDELTRFMDVAVC